MKIWYYGPAQRAAQLFVIFAIPAALLALAAIC
jgi:hypothetical protein